MSDRVTPWTAACQASLSSTFSWSLLQFKSFESMMLSNHLILCHPFLRLSSIFPSIRVFSKESAIYIRWPIGASVSASVFPMNIQVISFRIDWFDLQESRGPSRVFSSTTVQKHQFFFVVQLTSIHDYRKN